VSDLDLDDRTLCPDGACIGVIGADGRCKVCGRSEDGAAPVEVEAAAPADADADSFDPDRRLCPDGNCVGVIGPDDRCKICGTPAATDS
jgi:hypothetical protein